MSSWNNSAFFMLMAAIIFLAACQPPDLGGLKQNPMSMLKLKIKPVDRLVPGSRPESRSLSLGDILDGSLASGRLGSDFTTVLSSALEKDPVIISARRNAEAKLAAIQSTRAQKDFQVSGTVYGGIEDVTDNTKGVALALNASRLVFDGGMVDAQIASRRFAADSSEYELQATINERALRLGSLWVELEKYQILQNKIESRLAVLDPLIEQLEKVAAAGIGDVSKVTAAQRTVSAIRVAETNISEGLAQAQLNFANAFGALPEKVNYDYQLMTRYLPSKITDDLIHKSPLLLSQCYLSSRFG